MNAKTAALYGGLAIAGYFFVTKLLPKILEGIGKGAGDSVAGAAKGLSIGAGKVGGSILLAAPRAIDSALEELGLPPESLEKAGGAIGRGIYAATNAFNPAMEALYYTVNFPDGARHAIASSAVDARGRFKYVNVMYQIKDDAQGKHYATRL